MARSDMHAPRRPHDAYVQRRAMDGDWTHTVAGTFTAAQPLLMRTSRLARGIVPKRQQLIVIVWTLEQAY
jgi:hypothetical protein